MQRHVCWLVAKLTGVKVDARASPLGPRMGYADEWLDRLPDVVWASAAAVGNPFSIGPIHRGQTVVDLGCGAGADVCIAALLVGDTGKVYGIDATPAMAEKARSNARAAGLSQVEIHEGDIGHIDLPDAVADVVISNGAINLSSDKIRVLKEAHRILRPGGRLQIADMIREPAGEVATVGADESWAGCVLGTLAPECFIKILQEAGFYEVAMIRKTGYKTAPDTIGALFRALK